MGDLWEHLQQVLLLGTGRSSLSEKARQQLQDLGLHNRQGPEALQLLAGLSLLHYLRKGASVLPQLDTLPVGAPNDTGREPTPRLARLVARMLESEEWVPVFSEYMEYSVELNLLLPAEALPYLFETYQDDFKQVLLIREIMGQRGEWLARQRPDWAIFSQQFEQDIWHYGTPEERRAFFSHLRQADPAAARDLLEKNWADESRQLQPLLLAAFKQHLSIHDVPFLTSCLQHADHAIRLIAARWLVHLGNNPFSERLLATFRDFFYFDGTTFGWSATDSLPSEAKELLAIVGSKGTIQAERLARLLIRLVPPRHWEDLCGVDTSQTFAALQAASFYPRYRLELAESIHLHQDTQWMRCFIPAQYNLEKNRWIDTAIERLATRLPYEVFIELTTAYVQQHHDLIEGHSLMYQILLRNDHFWPASLSLSIIAVFQDYLRYTSNFWASTEADFYKDLLQQLALKSDTAILTNLQTGWPEDTFNSHLWEKGIHKMLEKLRFRANLQEAFAQLSEDGG